MCCDSPLLWLFKGEAGTMSLRKLALICVLLGALVTAGCGGESGSGSATISMAGSTFSGNTSVTIKAGQAVTFDDSSGGVHHLVTGTNGKFAAAQGAPSEFSSDTGVDFSPGDKKTITFPNAGTFQITCTIHSNMQATVTVTQS